MSDRNPPIFLVMVDDRYPSGPGRYNQPAKPLLGLLAEWKGIDLDRIEQEKQAMLAALRAMNIRAQEFGLDQPDAG